MNDANRIRIFDTTLRDGEQSPGASMNIVEKVEVARALATLGVDILEAGFPIASPGDFEAVRALPPQGTRAARCGPGPLNDPGIHPALEGPPVPPRPPSHLFFGAPAI